MNPMNAAWPRESHRDESGAIVIGGVRASDLVAEFGSPLYVYDELTLRSAMHDWHVAMTNALPNSRVVFAGKAFLAKALVAILVEEGLGLDCVSAGELYVGHAWGMPAGQLSLHGNNKAPDDLRMALDLGIGKIIVDNFDEIDELQEMAKDRERPQTVLIRVNPGVDVHTHRKISTGVADSKFGLPIADGQAAKAVEQLSQIPGLHFAGYHAHIGSQLMDVQGHVDALDEIIRFAAEMRDAHGVAMEQFSPGGGFGIAYVEGDQPMTPERWADLLSSAITSACERNGFDLPIVTIEPGRSIAGPAGVALYTVGARKEIPGVRTYVSVDGGMADNIRPALYEAVYTAELANRESDTARETVTIAGKFCESGDILIESIDLPPLERGDLLAIPAAGAYCLAMASNYNMAPRPAVVFVREGDARLVRRRETMDDLLRLDV